MNKITKLFVGGLPYSYGNQDLQNLFSEYGSVLSATVVIDRETNQSKGFGFVEFDDETAAQKAITELNGTDIDGRKIGVSIARPREDRPRDNNFRGGGGGFSRNNSGGGYNKGGFRRDNRGGGRR